MRVYGFLGIYGRRDGVINNLQNISHVRQKFARPLVLKNGIRKAWNVPMPEAATHAIR